MSDKASENFTPEEILKQKKAAHDYIATAVQILTTRVQYLHEEFEGVHTTVQFLRNMRDQITKDIEKIEPPKAKEAKAPYNMDLSHVKASEVNQ